MNSHQHQIEITTLEAACTKHDYEHAAMSRGRAFLMGRCQGSIVANMHIGDCKAGDADEEESDDRRHDLMGQVGDALRRDVARFQDLSDTAEHDVAAACVAKDVEHESLSPDGAFALGQVQAVEDALHRASLATTEWEALDNLASTASVELRKVATFTKPLGQSAQGPAEERTQDEQEDLVERVAAHLATESDGGRTHPDDRMPAEDRLLRARQALLWIELVMTDARQGDLGEYCQDAQFGLINVLTYVRRDLELADPYFESHADRSEAG